MYNNYSTGDIELDAAVEQMRRFIDDGMSYEDAADKTTDIFTVTTRDLKDAYNRRF